MPLFLFTMILALNLFIVQALLIAPIHFLFSLHLPTNLLLVGGVVVLAWLLGE